MNKTRLLLIFGGESSEHEVSLVSAANIYAALNPEKYHISLCYISPQGTWHLVERITDSHDKAPKIIPCLGEKSFLVDGKQLEIDVIFPVLHGKNGEDGTVQGLATLLHIPYVGPSVLSAAVTMDKDMTKRLAAAAGVPVVPWQLVFVNQPRPSYDELAEQLGAAFFVKPSRAGSSVGVSKVAAAKQLDAALDEAFRHDDTVLIETAVKAREIELAVIGNGVTASVSGAGEIIPGEEFYSYTDKYSTQSTSQAIIPAELNATTLAQLQSQALTAYCAIGGCGMSRIDFFLDDQGHSYLNEINSIPGFTNISMYPKLWQAAGVPADELVDRLISLAKNPTVVL